MKHLLRLPTEALPSTPEELPGEFRQVAEIIAEIIGDRKQATWAAWAIAMEFRGTPIYCRNMEEFFRAFRNRLIIAEFTRRTNAGETARAVVNDLALRDWPGDRVRISTRTVWEVLGQPDERLLKLPGCQ